MKADIANYDNATYYNDFVLSLIINHYKDRNAILVYFSDHGEEIYDYRPSKGRTHSEKPDEGDMIKYQNEIPFFVWCSDKYILLNKDVVYSIKKSTEKAGMTDNLGQMLFHLAGIRSSYYNEKYDILNSFYRCPRRILYDAKDYEMIKK